MSLLSSVAISVKDFTHWHTEASFNISNDVFITKFKSNLTGLKVVLTKTESPIVHLYICLATDANSDEGLPHALEHLIFLGSEKYPYKAVLDILANRLLASRPNAWTDVDHTCRGCRDGCHHVGGSGRKFACTFYIHDAMPSSIFGPVGPP